MQPRQVFSLNWWVNGCLQFAIERGTSGDFALQIKSVILLGFCCCLLQDFVHAALTFDNCKQGGTESASNCKSWTFYFSFIVNVFQSIYIVCSAINWSSITFSVTRPCSELVAMLHADDWHNLCPLHTVDPLVALWVSFVFVFARPLVLFDVLLLFCWNK